MTNLEIVPNQNKEKIVREVPHFSLSSLILKVEGSEHNYKIENLSESVMILSQVDEKIPLKVSDTVRGEIYWHGNKSGVEGVVDYVEQNIIHIKLDKESTSDITNLIKAENIANFLRPIHQIMEDKELPHSLSVWLSAEGPYQLFIWIDDTHHIDKLEFIYLNEYYEWDQGNSLTGIIQKKIISDDNILENEKMAILVDSKLNMDLKLKIKKIIHLLDHDKITNDLKEQALQIV